MYSTLAAILWFGGLLLMKQHPFVGACLAAAGFVAAGKAMNRPDDMPMFFGMVFLVVILVTAARLAFWLFSFL